MADFVSCVERLAVADRSAEIGHMSQVVLLLHHHRQVGFTIPKRLRVHAHFDRKLLGKLSACAWACIKAEVRRMLGREDVVPGMIAAIQTHGLVESSLYGGNQFSYQLFRTKSPARNSCAIFYADTSVTLDKEI